MEEKDEYMQQVLIDEEEAKKSFLEELRNKNLEETREFERALLEKALLEKANSSETVKEEEKALEQIASDVHDDENDKKEDEKEDEKEDIKEDIQENNESNQVKESKKVNNNTINILKTAIIDTAVTAVASIAAVYLFDLIIRLLFGYYVVDFKGAYIIAFIIILVLYPVLMKNAKCGKTIGEKFSKAEVKEREE